MALRAVVLSREEPFFVPEYLGPLLDCADLEIVRLYLDRRRSPHLDVRNIARMCTVVGMTKLIALETLAMMPGGLALAGFQGPRSIAALGRAHGVPIRRIASIDGSMVDEIRTLAPDLILSVANPHVLPPPLLAAAKIAALNSHASLLPRHRGVLTAFWTLLDGDAQGGVSIHRMEEEVDRGAVVAQAPFAIAPDETVFSYYRKAALVGGRLWLDVVSRLARGEGLESLTEFDAGDGTPIRGVPTPDQTMRFRRAGRRFI